jgi:DNA-binding IclR family transcriptional regulator
MARPPRTPPETAPTDDAAGGVSAVNRALGLLDVLAQETDGMLLGQWAERSGLYPSTILRLAASLQGYGYVKRLADGRFVLGPTPFFLGSVYQQGFRSTERILPALRELTRATRESAALYVREGRMRVCLHRTDSPRSVRDHVREGDRFELDASAAARVLRAFGGSAATAEAGVRTKGYAISKGGRDPETAALAAPVFGMNGVIFGALSLSLPRYRYSRAWVDEVLPPLLATCHALSLDLGARFE